MKTYFLSLDAVSMNAEADSVIHVDARTILMISEPSALDKKNRKDIGAVIYLSENRTLAVKQNFEQIEARMSEALKDF